MRSRQLCWTVPITALLLDGCVDASRDTSPTAPSSVTVRSSVGGTNPGDPLPGLTPAEQAQFQQGLIVFSRQFVPVTGSGPLFNGGSCLGCHSDPAAGGGSGAVERHVSNFNHATGVCDDLKAFGGPVIQRRATPALIAAMGITEEPVPPQASVVAQRTSVDVFGFGLLEAVSEAQILALADPHDLNLDGVSGRPNFTPSGLVGRFGRKATTATLREFNDDAFLEEMGVTSPAFPQENNIGGQPIPPGVDPVADPEISNADADLANNFVRFLAPPPRGPMTAQAHIGEPLFVTTGCSSCHVPKLRTGPNSVAALSNREVHAYTDLLLHDMGPALADICRTNAQPAEFRTEPLMGLRFLTRFLHDGRAHTVEQAILLHGGEATSARNRFALLPSTLRNALLAFLNTL